MEEKEEKTTEETTVETTAIEAGKTEPENELETGKEEPEPAKEAEEDSEKKEGSETEEPEKKQEPETAEERLKKREEELQKREEQLLAKELESAAKAKFQELGLPQRLLPYVIQQDEASTIEHIKKDGKTAILSDFITKRYTKMLYATKLTYSKNLGVQLDAINNKNKTDILDEVQKLSDKIDGGADKILDYHKTLKGVFLCIPKNRKQTH